jgi:hypothetical protein
MAALIIGCPDPVNSSTPEPTPDPTPPTTPTPLTPPAGSTSLPSSDFMTKLGDATYYEIPSTGLTVSGAATFTVSATKKLKFTGDLTLDAGSFIVFKSKDSIEGSGKIKGAAAQVIIAGDGLAAALADATSAKIVPFFTGTALPTGSDIGIDGSVTIGTEDSAPASANAIAKIKNSDLAGKNLYVFGDLTVTGEVTAASIYVTGKVTATDKKITTTNLTVKQGATAIGALTNTAAATFTFDGATTIGIFTPGEGGTTIAGAGAVTITTALSITGTNTVKITNTGGVTLSGETATIIAPNLTVTKAKITGVAAGVTIPGSTDITIPTGASIATTTETGSQIVAGGTDNKVTLTKATLGPGTYTGAADGLTLGATTEVTVDAGEVKIAGAGVLKFNDTADSTLILKAGAKLDVAVGGDITGNAHANVTLLVGTSATPTEGTNKAVTKVAGPPAVWTVTTASEFSAGTGNANVPIVLGKIQFALTGGATAEAGGDATAGAGTLTAGAGTALTLAGPHPSVPTL